MLSRKVEFKKAIPVWAEGRTEEMNLSLIFRLKTVIDNGKKNILRLTASSVYQLFVNGEMKAVGPARCGHGFFRVDEVAIRPEGNGECEIAIIVAGYNVNAFSYIDQSAFLCAELLEDGEVKAYTAPETDGRADGFSATVHVQRIRKIQRYSFQRPFAEAYDMRRRETAGDRVKLAPAKAGEFLERGVPDADFGPVAAESIICRGAAHIVPIRADERILDRVICEPDEKFKCFPLGELEVCTAWEAQSIQYTVSEPGRQDFCETTVPDGSYVVIDMGREHTGMIELRVSVKNVAEVYVLESELLTDNRPDGVDFHRLGDSDLVKWTLPAGRHDLVTFEPYSFRYAKIVVFGADLEVHGFGVRSYCFRQIAKTLPASVDGDIRLIYGAAVETFRQNSVDIYMDCPSRERAGWLCDSYFTSRTEKCLTGESLIERNFLENFLLPEKFEFLPEGMLPMCYPADHNDGTFIPTWAMWYVVELGEYLERTGDRELVDFAKKKMYALLDYFRPFENEFGLLEGLKSWVFIEWSRSNELVQDVNFPVNFLYSKMLSTMAELYGDEALRQKSETLLSAASAISFNGRFFCDNAYRRGNRLVPSGECTESCQYYAFYFGAATAETHPDLFKIMVDDFGPGREEKGSYPEIAPANAFIGNYLRLDWLMRIGLKDKVLENIRGYFLGMAERTGTLWELQKPVASCNHGFASHVAVWLDEIYNK